MPADPKKRQKKLERKNADRKAKKRALARATPAGLAKKLAAASLCPVLDCFVPKVLWEEGMGTVVLSRQLPNTSVAFATFMLDRYCLGVKDAFAHIEGGFSYRQRIAQLNSRFPSDRVSPEYVRKLVEGAVAYAADLGLPPHPDYQEAQVIFGDIDASACAETFEYGRDGKPLFISGPYDSPTRCRRILDAIEARLGPGEYGSVMPAFLADGELIRGKGELILDSDDDEFEDDEDED